MKSVYNKSQHKFINVELEGEVTNIPPLSMKNVSDEVADLIKQEWPEAQVTNVSKAKEEPWELKILVSLPPEMQAKVQFSTPKKLVPAAEPELVEPPVTMDATGKPDNTHVCPRGCGYASPYLGIVRKHMKKCAPIPSME